MPEADDRLDEQLPRMRAAWMGARSAVDYSPPAWREAIGEGAAAEAGLAALVGHAVQTMFRPTAPALTPQPLLPRLAAPTPPATARARLRRLMAGKIDEAAIRGLVRLVWARGYIMHPADWTPGPRDDWAPAIYAPWLAWAASERTPPASETLTADNYEDWPPTQRRAALAALRRADPAGARGIIAARVAGEPAERRLQFVELLDEGLTSDDASFLESLATDRSERVQAEARRLLARLGHGVGDAELAAELAQMVDLAKVGLIRRRRQLKLKKLKTVAQEKRRRDLLGLVSLPDLARALDVPEAALVEAAPEGDVGSVIGFVAMAAQTGSDDACQSLLAAILQDDGDTMGFVCPLAGRLTPAERVARLPEVVARDPSPTFAVSLDFAGEALGATPARALDPSPAYRALETMLRTALGADDAARLRVEPHVKAALANLGLLADPGAAQSVLEACAAAGLSPADPRLDLLHLNIALKPERPT